MFTPVNEALEEKIPRVVLVSPIAGTHPIMKASPLWAGTPQDGPTASRVKGVTSGVARGRSRGPEPGEMGGSTQDPAYERLDSDR